MLKLEDDWEYNVLGVYNYKKPGPFDSLFDFIKNNHTKFNGDIVEAGVYRGKSLLAIAMLLNELGSDKKVYGYDSFSGFPPVYSSKDDFSQFEEMLLEKVISQKHMNAIKKNLEWKKILTSEEPTPKNISSSGSFSETSLQLVQKKIELLELDNIVLIDGPFDKTMVNTSKSPEKIMAVLMDCDLYQSYMDTFNFVWPRLEPQGMIYLDEYYSLKFPGARIATHEFIKDRSARLEKAPQKEGDFERWFLTKEK